jgi:hypothetical protein
MQVEVRGVCVCVREKGGEGGEREKERERGTLIGALAGRSFLGRVTQKQGKGGGGDLLLGIRPIGGHVRCRKNGAARPPASFVIAIA